MKDTWQTEKLGSVCSFVNRGISPTYVDDGGLRVLNQRCIRDHVVNFGLARQHDVRARTVEKARLVQRGDVLVNSTGTGTLGRVAQLREDLSEPTTVDSHVTIVRPIPDKFFPDFFGYALIAIEDQIKEAGEGCGGQTELARSTLAEKFRITFPHSVTEQRRIVGALDKAFAAIATAIANTEKNLQNARGCFKSCLNSVFSSPGSDWTERRLGEVYDVRDGTHDSPKYYRVGYPLVTSKNLKPEGLSLEDVSLINEHDYRKINERSAVHCGDVLFAMIGTIGNPTVVSIEPEFAIKNVALFKMGPGQNGHFLKYYLSSDYAVSKMEREAKGTTQKFVGLNYLRCFPIRIPPLQRQLEVVAKLDSLSTAVQRLVTPFEKKIAALDELKKSLLTEAFLGSL